MNRAEQAFIGAVSRINDQRGKPAYLGKTDGTLYWVAPNGTTYRTKVWARIGEEASRQEQIVDCLAVSPQLDMPVRVDHVNGVLTVIDIDNRWYAEFSGDRPGGKVGAHAWLHSRLGPDPLFVSGLQYLPLLVTPTNPTDLTVTVQAGAYMLDDGSLQFLETAVSGSLSSYVPGSGYHFVVVCLDRPNDAIVIVDGADVSNSSDALFGKATVSKANIEAVSISADYWPLAVVLLYAGQTQITARDITHDLRPGNSGGGSGGAVAGADTQVIFNDGGAYAGDSGLTFTKATDTLTSGRVIVGSGETVDSEAKLGVILLTSPSGTVQSVPLHNPATGDFNETAFDFHFEDDASAQKLYARIEGAQLVRTAGSEDGEIQFRVIKAGTLTPVLRVRGDNGITDFLTQDINIRGTGNDSLFFTDFSANTVNIGTNGDADAIATFGPSVTIINNSESDRDFRIAGNGVTNGVYYDGGNNRLGINTGDPQAAIEARGDGETSVHARTHHVSQSSQFALFRARGTESSPSAIKNGDILGAFSFRGYDGSSFTGSKGFIAVHAGENWTGSATGTQIRFSATANGSTSLGTRMTIQNGVQVGSPTGGDKGIGTINTAADIYKNNSAYTNPDYALEMWATGEIKKHAHRQGARGYRRYSLNETEQHIREHYRLPGIVDKPMGIFERGDFVLEKLEELFTHVIELNKKVEALNG